jgi:hypothetical protein
MRSLCLQIAKVQQRDWVKAEGQSDKSRTCPQPGLTGHRSGATRTVLASASRPNPRSESCSYPFSDGFQRSVIGSSYTEGTEAHTLERGIPRGMRMMKVDPSPSLLRTSMLPL